jgi:dTDP-3,4-didehydro-2,6-dideoxy-alpha-D-glucose 3-reductase
MSTMSTMELRVGVLGCADIALRRVLPAITAVPGMRTAVVGSRDLAKAQAATAVHGGTAVEGYAAVLESDVDAVYVPLPAALRPVWVGAALRAGKHVLAEKPVAPAAERTAELFALARAQGRTLMDNVMFVHHDQHTAVAKLVADGVIGRLRSFHATFAVPARPDGDIRLNPRLGGGALLDVGVYPVRAAVRFLGEDLTVEGAVAAGQAVDTSGSVLLRAPDDVAVHLTYGMDDAYCATYELRGTEGRIVVDRAFTPPADLEPEVTLHRRSGAERVRLPAMDQVAATVAAFADAARSGRVVDERQVLGQAAVLDAVRRRTALPTTLGQKGPK